MAAHRPKYPVTPIPPEFDCWAYNRVTGEIFPAYEYQGEPWVDFKDRYSHGDPNDWEILYDPIVEEVAFVLAVLVGVFILLTNWS